MVRRIAPLSDSLALLRLHATLRSIRPDLVHTHASKAGVLGRVAARLAGVPAVLHTPHAYFFQGKRGAARRLFCGLERTMLPLTSATVALCESQRRLAVDELGAAPGSVEVVANGVDTSHFAARAGRSAARQALGLPEEAPVLGSIVRLSPQKGCDLFLQALARVAAKLPALRAVLVGDGPLRRRVQRLACRLGVAGRLIRLPHADDPRRIYEALDVFVLPSRYEGMPYVLLEAMAMGLPVAATDIPGIRDVVADGATGLLAAPGRPQELTQCILQLLRDPERARRMGSEGRQRVVQHFALRPFLERTAALYLRTAASAESPPGLPTEARSLHRSPEDSAGPGRGVPFALGGLA